ncbi:fumarylacetoacetate hydrolase family protein [Pseudogulbenkiania ferrooxidans]|uniref:Fumarylacetoacetate (FAA) hydrolase n=1 Tax=Pseudogulbenkiania ferrooxidans 2002 TaxID=279714 RepID=B9Z222_9NEIS|nr:fumarylacetoacetate hydrolase family protein [Pseudogulbenkiania ferrooxidans]EEG09467.1 fumarylacetoacetate (FAA) hydrolase [Pseudogulbenkiania ferrooxidans 2002]
MKLATYQNHTRDGQLMVVSHDLSRAVAVPHIADTLQAALDDWNVVEPQLQQVYQALNRGEAAGIEAFDPTRCHSPLPRAYQWADGSAYLNHVELVRKARGATVPDSFYLDPLMYQGGSDNFLPPCAPIPLRDEAWGLDFEGEVAVITGDVALGAGVEACGRAIRLLMLVNDVTLRNLIPSELAKGFGFFQSKPATAFSPVAVTPDELGEAWHEGKVHLPLLVDYNGRRYGEPDAGVEMQFGFPELVAHVAKTRALCAGSIVGSGTVSNHDRRVGSCCLAEQRMIEIIDSGEARTPFMKVGDTVRIEMHDASGASVFGAIEQTVVAHD